MSCGARYFLFLDPGGLRIGIYLRAEEVKQEMGCTEAILDDFQHLSARHVFWNV
jgi:hypothetical protein